MKPETFEETVSQYDRALKIQPDNIEALNKLTDLYIENEQFEEALAICRKTIKVKPNLADAYKIEGKILEAKGDLEGALVAYSKLLELQPQLAECHLLLGNLYRKQNRLEEAIASYRKSLEIQPQLAISYIHLGDIYCDQKLLEKSISCYQKPLGINQNFAFSYFPRILKLGLTVRENDNLLNKFTSLYPKILEPLSPFIKHTSAASNIYHCCVPKTASTWMKRVLTDFRIYSYSGLAPFQVELLKDSNQLPDNTILTGTFAINFEKFAALKKPENYKAFFVMRDPRDIIISDYFSNRYSHSPMDHINETRKVLNRVSLEEGIVYTIEILRDVFATLNSWIDAESKNANVLLLRYEDLTGDNSFEYFQQLCRHCDIQIPDEELQELIKDYSFEKLSGGRKHGQEDQNSHYRKGVSGDWKNYFNREIKEKFEEIAGDLVTHLGYSWDGFEFDVVSDKSLADSSENNGLVKPSSQIKDAESVTRQSQLYYQQGKLDEALVACDRELSEAYQMRGQILLDKGEIDGGILAYSNALEIESNSVELHLHIARLYYDNELIEKAIECYQKTLEIKPDFADAYFYIGGIYLEQNKLEAAISCYQESIKLNPDLADSYFYLGNIYREKNLWDEAIESYQKSLEIKPELADSYFYLESIYRQQNKLEEAINCQQRYQKIKSTLAS